MSRNLYNISLTEHDFLAMYTQTLLKVLVFGYSSYIAIDSTESFKIGLKWPPLTISLLPQALSFPVLFPLLEYQKTLIALQVS